MFFCILFRIPLSKRELSYYILFLFWAKAPRVFTKKILSNISYFSIEIRTGNGSDYKNNPLCSWINIRNSQNVFSLVECISFARYVTLSSVGSEIPLTICSVQVLTSNSKSTSLCDDTKNNDENKNAEMVIFQDICYLR